MEKKLRDLLESGVKEIDSQLCNEAVIGKLSCLYDQITVFNDAYGLVAAKGEDIVKRHILDCLAPVVAMKNNRLHASIADLGSGSGLPGIVLASALPDWNFTLVERMGRRAGFLRNTLALCGLASSVDVIQSDLSQVKKQFDCLVFRAFRPVSAIEKDLVRLTAPGSEVFIYKSSDENINEDIQAAESDFSCRLIPYSVPFLDAKRNLLVLTRI